ncbi:MAG: ketopantoate reductase family protein [Leptolinea sp.]|nr:ketopantoate reductase family protein [Leptolinea sp.]
MKILVYGAGVLGSFLAHVLHRGKNNVTLLARGNRLSELQEKGLNIRHYLQFQTTIDDLPVIEKLVVDDVYDLCFVVMQRQQIDEVLPEIASCTGSRDFVLVGTNLTAIETRAFIDQNSPVKKNLAFGFQTSGGRCEPGRVISIHTGSGSMVLGSLSPDEALYSRITKAFENTRYRLIFMENMDAWLKCHAAFILPIAFACYYADGDLRRVSRNSKMLNLMIDAIDDAYQIVKAAGYPIIPPGNDVLLRKNRPRYYWLLKIMAATPIGRLAASDHAMSARAEMCRLYTDFCQLKTKADINTPAWDEMAKFMDKC